MDSNKYISEEELGRILRSLPEEKTPPELNERIMEQIRKERGLREKRAEKNNLIWMIILAAFIFAAGAAALYFYVDWSLLSTPERVSNGVFSGPDIAEKIYGIQQSPLFKSLAPLAVIILLLLIGDTLLRRGIQSRHRQG